MTAIAVGDFSDDGLPDIAVAEISPDESEADSACSRTRAWTNSRSSTRSPSILNRAVQVIAFGNGTEDLAVADYSTGNVAIFVSDGERRILAGPDSCWQVAVAPSAMAAGRLDAAPSI